MEHFEKTLLIADDDGTMRMALAESLQSCGYQIETAENGAEALTKYARGHFGAVITDMRMPKMSGMDVLRGIKKISPATPVILITAYGTVSTAVEAMKEGASEFIMKPFSLDDLEFVVKNVLAAGAGGEATAAEAAGDGAYPEREIVTKDPGMLSLLSMLKGIARSKSSVLIQGESGTGKELIARFIYRHSNRRQRPFVAVNCAAIPHNLLESEMFGYERGAFTGASQRKVGKFELADGGTLLLDEISEMDVQLQAKLLRVIQESEVDRVGGKEPTPVDVRILATTNADLKTAIEEKRFRGDLYYRINVIPVKVPPLRERKGDIGILSEHFLKKYSSVNECGTPRLSRESLAVLQSHSWPGNIRELENIMERAVLICAGGEILPEHLGLEGQARPAAPAPRAVEPAAGEAAACAGAATLGEMEKNMIFETLRKVNGNKTKASKILGISVRTMRNKLHEYGQGDSRH
ncbi:MAG TPA: sigma-54 dependent transcriptional regulator [Syntrophales bacterium]|nr:sigma-54 dependent transcriptional regulator [Syntrophales bacterium]